MVGVKTLRKILNPAWVLGLLAVAIFTWACFTILAPWQLGKNAELEARNDRLTNSVVADPAPVREVADSPADWVEHEWRLVTLSGEFTGDADAMLRLRAVAGDPVFHVLGAFRADDGTEYLVDRGTIPVGEGNTVGDYEAAPEGEQEIMARIRAPEPDVHEPVVQDGYTMVRSVVPDRLADPLGVEFDSDGYLQLVQDQPGTLTAAPVPSVEEGPYLSYGLQWLAFGVFAPIALLYLAWNEFKARRRDRAESAGPSGGSGTGTGEIPPSPGDDDPGPVPPGGGPPAGAVDRDPYEQTLQSRYGSRFEAERRRARKQRDRFAEL